MALVDARDRVIGLVRSLSLEVAEHGITVNAVQPNSVNTALLHKVRGVLEPEDVSGAIPFLVTDRRST